MTVKRFLELLRDNDTVVVHEASTGLTLEAPVKKFRKMEGINSHLLEKEAQQVLLGTTFTKFIV